MTGIVPPTPTLEYACLQGKPRLDGGGGNRTREAFPTLLERDGPGCFYCRKTPDSYQVDHVRPRSRGGKDELDNLVLSCSPCNYEKLAHPAWVFVFYRELGVRLPQTFRRRFDPAKLPALSADWARGDWVGEITARVLDPSSPWRAGERETEDTG